MAAGQEMKPAKAAGKQASAAHTPQNQVLAKKQVGVADLPGKIQNLASRITRIDLDGSPGDLLTLPVAALTVLPESCENIAVIRASLNISLIRDFGATLSPPEREQVAAHNPRMVAWIVTIILVSLILASGFRNLK